MAAERLSPFDASFLAVERPNAPMHVGWVALFDPPSRGARPGFEELFSHLAGRMGMAPRYRQRLEGVPFGLHDPVWVDDPDFHPTEHLLPGAGAELDDLADAVFSEPLPRDRPLWEVWIHDELPDGGIALVGKAHHCMVDGVAAMQLANLVLDKDPVRGGSRGADGWEAAPRPSAGARLADAVTDRLAGGATIAAAPLRFARSPSNVLALPGAAARSARLAAHTLLPPAVSGSALNLDGSGARHHVRVMRPLDALRGVRRRFGVTPNDVVLAAAAGGLRRFLTRRGETPQPMKAMVPADVRAAADEPGAGNRISFTFLELPCDEPDPVARLRRVGEATASRSEDAAEFDAAMRALALGPRPLQRALAHAFAHPRLFNLVVSSVAGPAVPRYLRGCRLRAIHPAVPLTGRHALSIGVLTVAGQACFGLYADPAVLPDADTLAEDLGAAVDELTAC